jgi:hypothetical protein
MVWTRLVDALSSRAAFYPPDPPSYELAAHGDGAHEAYLRPTQRGLRPVPRAVALRVPLPGRGGGEVVAALVAPPGGAPRGLLLHSHGEFSCVLGRPVEAENILETTNQPTNQPTTNYRPLPKIKFQATPSTSPRCFLYTSSSRRAST